MRLEERHESLFGYVKLGLAGPVVLGIDIYRGERSGHEVAQTLGILAWTGATFWFNPNPVTKVGAAMAFTYHATKSFEDDPEFTREEITKLTPFDIRVTWTMEDWINSKRSQLQEPLLIPDTAAVIKPSKTKLSLMHKVKACKKGYHRVGNLCIKDE